MDEPADIGLPRQFVKIIVDLRQDISNLLGITEEFRDPEEVVRLCAGLLRGIINEDCIGLVPASADQGQGMGSLNSHVTPDGLKPFVALDALMVVCSGEAEFVTAPDGAETRAV